MRLPAGAMLLLRQGAAPILAGKVSYFADPEFQVYSINRTHPGS
jgi:type IV secretory pathway TraG/TraD family ATPase VirD4